MDLIAAGIGFVVGIIATAFAIDFGVKKLFAPPDNEQLTTMWSLRQLRDPLVASTGPLPAQLPGGARVLTRDPVDPQAHPAARLRRSRELAGNFAVEASGNRALLLTDGMRPGALALVTLDARTADLLRREFQALWNRAEVAVEELPIAQVTRSRADNVRTVGTVDSVAEHRDGWMLRLTDEGASIAVKVDRPLAEAVGRRIAVTGRLVRGASGAPILDARGGPAPPMERGRQDEALAEQAPAQPA